jgi:tetratricopeptide (TPR) repeat protein
LIRSNLAYWHCLWQDSDELETIQEALRMAEESKQPVPILVIRFTLGAITRWRGEPLRGLEYTEGMVEILHSMFNLGLAGLISFWRGQILTDVGRYSEAIRLQGKWIDTFEQNPNHLLLGRFYNCQGWTHSEVYDLEKALSLNSRSMEVGDMVVKNPVNIYSAMEMRAQTEVNLMENAFEMGKVTDAWDHILRFEEESMHPDFAFLRNRWLGRMEDLKGNILLSRGDLDSAEALARESLEGSRKRKYKKYVGKAERLLGKVLAERQAHDQAEARLKSAVSELEEVGNPKQLWITHTALARLYGKMGRPDLEREQWQAAKAIVETTAAGLVDEQLRTTFLNAAPVREIIQGVHP